MCLDCSFNAAGLCRAQPLDSKKSRENIRVLIGSTKRFYCNNSVDTSAEIQCLPPKNYSKRNSSFRSWHRNWIEPPTEDQHHTNCVTNEAANGVDSIQPRGFQTYHGHSNLSLHSPDGFLERIFSTTTLSTYSLHAAEAACSAFYGLSDRSGCPVPKLCQQP